MLSSSSNLVQIAKVFVIFAIITTIYLVMIMSKPTIQDKVKVFVSFNSAELRAQQSRLSALRPMVRQNSDKLPKRAKNISAQTLCAQKLACAPQFRKYETMLRVSPKYKMVNCVVQKSMSTMMTGAMCYLYDEMEYENTGRSFDDEFNGRLCKSQNEFSSVNDVRNKYNISLRQTGWSFSMVVRHPIDRFVSGYVDRCVRLLVMNATAQCNGCRLNMTCFIENEYKRLMQISYKRKTRRTMEDAHFFPQVWHCDLPDEREFFEFLPYSTDSEEEFMPHFEDLLQRQDVPESSIQFIRDQFLTRIPSHATTGTAAKRFYYNRLMNSPYLLEFIVKMFYWDFIQFHYAFPPGFEQ